MADYGIDINVNMGSAGGNFQTLIDSINNLNANLGKIGTATKSGTESGSAALYKYKGDLDKLNETITATRNKLREQLPELNRLRQAYEAAALTTKTLVGASKEQIAAHKQARQEYVLYARSVKANETSLKNLLSVQRQYNSVLGQTAVTAKSAKSSFAGLTKTLNTLAGVMGTSFGLFGAFMVLKNAIKTIADFDLAQKKLQSVLGETAEGMKELSKSAIDLGKNSIFGAKGVSELQIELAKMGFTKTEIMAMQSAINDLAIATQEDLASSAETVANIIKTFNLSATETRDVVNVMGRAFNDSALGLANFREGIKYVAPVAKQAGLSFRETVAAMELLANAGLKGSLTGTALNNVLKAMMDSNSKLAKSMGGTVSGWEGFVSVLQRAKKEGWNMQDIFGLITQRATGAFSVLMDGVGTLEEMNQKLKDVSFTISDMTAVQLDSITYKAKLVKEAWNGFILEMDKGDNALSKMMKRSLATVANLLSLLSGGTAELRKEINNMGIELYRALANPYLDENTRIALEGQKKLIDQASKEIARMNNEQLSGFTLFYTGVLNEANEAINQIVTESADKIVESYNIVGKSAEDFESKQKQALTDISAQMTVLGENTKLTAFQYKVLQEAFSKINKMSFERTSPLVTDSDSERLKAIRDRFKTEIEMLKQLQRIEALRIQNATDGYLELMLLADSKFKFETAIANKELERDIALGQNKEKAKEFNVLRLQEIELEYANTVQDINLKMNKEINKDTEKALTEREKIVKDIVEQTVDDIIKEYQRLTDLNKFMDKFGQDNPIINMLFGKGLRSDLLSGAISEDDVTYFADSFEKLFSSIDDSINSYVDSWVEATDRIVDQLNRQIDETQSALEVEAELMAAGYANNVSLKKKELEDLKAARKTALDEQRKAQQAEVAIDTITQISSLITASAQIIKGFSKIPVVGVGLGIAAVTLMLSAFAAAKAQAFKTAGVSKFAEGGWIGGKSHRDGGTHIEAEKGEYVINKRSAFKHKELIEAINGDNKYELNKIYLNNLKNQVLTASVSLDDSKYLKGIYEKLNEKGKAVEYINGYRIERVGNVTTKIRLN